MHFDSIGHLIEMGGHGPYVWGAYALTALVLVGLAIAARRERQRFFKQQNARLRRERAQTSPGGQPT